MTREWNEFVMDKNQLFNNLKPKTMNFKKITICDSGFKGISVEYFQEELKNGKPMLVLTKKYPKNPVHLGLEKLFKELRIHLLQNCDIISDSLDESIQPYFVQETIVETIELDGDSIILKGKKTKYDDKTFPLQTCKIQESDGYFQYEILKELVENICIETEAYLAGSVVVDDTEVAIRYLEAGKAKGVNIDEIKALPPEKLKEWATAFLENSYGAVVLHNEDMQVENEQILAVVEELNTEFDVTAAGSEIEIPIVDAKPKRKSKAPKEAPVVSEASSPNDSETEF